MEFRPPSRSRRRKGPPTFWRPGSVVGPQRPPGHCSPAPRHHLPATTCPPPTDLPKSGSFACWIPHYLDLSPNVPVTNTQSIWLRFGAFLSPSASSLHFHWPLVTGHWSLLPRYWPSFSGSTLHASRSTPHPHQRGQDVRGPSPAGYCHPPTAEFPMNSPARSGGRGSLVPCWSGRRWHNFPSPVRDRELAAATFSTACSPITASDRWAPTMSLRYGW